MRVDIYIFALTRDAQPALGRIIIRIIVRIVTGVPEEGAAVKASQRTIVAQIVHDGAAHNGRVHNIECDIRGFAPNHTLLYICAEMWRK